MRGGGGRQVWRGALPAIRRHVPRLSAVQVLSPIHRDGSNGRSPCGRRFPDAADGRDGLVKLAVACGYKGAHRSRVGLAISAGTERSAARSLRTWADRRVLAWGLSWGAVTNSNDQRKRSPLKSAHCGVNPSHWEAKPRAQQGACHWFQPFQYALDHFSNAELHHITGHLIHWHRSVGVDEDICKPDDEAIRQVYQYLPDQ